MTGGHRQSSQRAVGRTAYEPFDTNHSRSATHCLQVSHGVNKHSVNPIKISHVINNYDSVNPIKLYEIFMGFTKSFLCFMCYVFTHYHLIKL